MSNEYRFWTMRITSSLSFRAASISFRETNQPRWSTLHFTKYKCEQPKMLINCFSNFTTIVFHPPCKSFTTSCSIICISLHINWFKVVTGRTQIKNKKITNFHNHRISYRHKNNKIKSLIIGTLSLFYTKCIIHNTFPYYRIIYSN